MATIFNHKNYTNPAVFIVDNDSSTRHALSELIRSVGIGVKCYKSVLAFLDEYNPDIPGCLVLDVRLPGISGLELQDYFRRKEIRIPIIFVSGHSNIAIAVRSMKAGAIDFIEKPFDDQQLLDSVNKALEIDRLARYDEDHHSRIMERIKRLSPREEEVLQHLILGKSNKIIAAEMHLSTKTIETHRAHIMKKLGVKSMAGLMWMAIKSGNYQNVPDQLPFQPLQSKQQTLSLL